MGKYRILVVEDSTAIRKSLINLLKPLNAEIIGAENGLEGLKLVSDNDFDIIISDIDMPELNGIELCKSLKNSVTTRHIPIIIVSSFDSDDDIGKGFTAGASAYISKDEAKDLLFETTSDILTKSTLQRKQTIMVVDDSRPVKYVVEDGLLKEGFKVVTAENGLSALNLLKNVKPDLILSDINMPVMNGIEFCQAVHSDSRLSNIPFVVMSTNSERGIIQRMLQHGAVAYITKPFNIHQLVIMVEKILSDQFLLLFHERERLDAEKNMMIDSIASLVTALEARDAYTKGHSEAVGNILSGMLELAGASKSEVESGIIGGKLHDIGKIGIRDDILLKPGRLTNIEFSKIQEHPAIGAKIIENIPSLSEIQSIVQFHHERLDGTGYPMGLKGSKIPLWARMTAVADTYHAITSKRPYRKACKHELALQEINDVKGTQLCPECVDLFLKWIGNGKKSKHGIKKIGTTGRVIPSAPKHQAKGRNDKVKQAVEE